VKGNFDPHSIGLSAFRNIDFQKYGLDRSRDRRDRHLDERTLLGRPAAQMAAYGAGLIGSRSYFP